MAKSHVPLAEQLRPKELSGIVDQEHLLGEEGFITRTIRSGVWLLFRCFKCHI